MEPEKQHLFDKPNSVKWVLRILYLICIILFALDFVVYRHTLHAWEKLWGFYAIYGFVGCVVLVLVAKWMRTFLMRSEDYYDREELKGMESDRDVDA